MSGVTTDDDTACTGSRLAPTAPAGKVCIYLYDSMRVINVDGRRNYVNDRDGFIVTAQSDGLAGLDMYVEFSWAYWAP